ncbi:hypothetical protein AJ79_08038 [Helicocarpus griseus UAMH5409]|uniref:Cytochrome P450 oxidoreductase n=1 Tax=Helicocarpus griseus UAMH5409 TaxID=1447875 RepID=A0A2B7WXA9_9EURO|nr:hypothetical protein AJ79_08038 [Helicocarpus griseus UAMH5409]
MASQAFLLGASITVAAIWLTVTFIRYLLSTQRPKDFPPGPPTFPGLGNLHQIPLKLPFIKFQEWSKTYGDIVGLKLGSNNLIVLHNPEHMHELFEKRSAIYSGRPYAYIPVEHVYQEHKDKHIINLQNTPYLRKWRANVAYLVSTAGIRQNMPIQEATAATLVNKLLQQPSSPSDCFDHFKYWALATPLLAISGQRLEDHGKTFTDRFCTAQQKWVEILEPGTAPLATFFPPLRWVPERFSGWKKKARYVREYMIDEYFSLVESAKKFCISPDNGGKPKGKSGYDTGRFRCVLTRILEEVAERKGKGQENQLLSTDAEIAYVGGGLLDAAVDTTLATFTSLIMFMAAYPEVQAKACEEIHRVSPDKPPGANVAGQLPYVQACVTEIIRLRPPVPSGLSHLAERDDVFMGYKIPKGTSVLANAWAIHQNTDDFDHPEEFRPERYLQNPVGIKPDAKNSFERRRPTYTFGAGRRVCPGTQFAENAVAMAISKVLWAFKIVAPEPLDLSLETGFHSGLVTTPNPFKVDFVLHDEARKESVVLDHKETSAALEQIGI